MALLRTLFGDESNIVYDRNFQLLLAANLLGVLGTALVSPVVDSLIGPFGITEAKAGLIMAVFSAPSIVLIPVIGALTDRYGRKQVLIVGLLIYSIAGAGIAATASYTIVLLLRLLQGVGFAGVLPTIITSIGDLYEDEQEATAQGFRFTCSGISQMAFPLLAGFLVVLNWRYPFLLFAVGIPVAVMIYLWFDEPSSVVNDDGARAEGVVNRAALREIFGNRSTVAVVLARGFPSVAWVGFLTYNSVLVSQTFNGTAQQAGGLVAATSLIYATTASQAGRISAWFDHWIIPIVAGNGFLFIGLGVVALTSSFIEALLGVFCLGIGIGTTLSLYRSVITGLPSEETRGSIVSISEAFARLTGTLTPIAMGAAIGFLQPHLGINSALRTTFLGVAIVSSAPSVALSAFAAWKE